MDNVKEKVSTWINNEKSNTIYFFFFNFFCKNIKINGILLLLILFAWVFYIHHHSFLSGALLGIIGSAIASFNLIDGYKEYKMRNVKIHILSLLKSQTDGLFETMLGYTKEIFHEVAHAAKDEKQEKLAYEIWNKQSNLWVHYHNLKKDELTKKIEELSKLIFNYCVEFHSPENVIDFSVAISKINSIKDIVSSQLTLVNDELLLSSYVELILIMSHLESEDLPENISIGGNDIDDIRNCFYLLMNCYKFLLCYKEQINEYVKIRNKKHDDFFALTR